MKTAIRYPIRFSAVPPRGGRRKEVVCSYLHVHDVPELSVRDTDTVLEIGTTVPKPERLIEYDGRLFRKIGRGERDGSVAAFPTAFMPFLKRNGPWKFTFEGGNRGEEPPISQALDNLVAYRMYLDGNGWETEEEAWPTLPKHPGYIETRSRNEFRFEEIEHKLKDVDFEMLERGRREIALEAGKLILVDGSYWFETPPPAISVACEGYGVTARMVAEITYLPNWLDRRLDRQYFPLSASEEAIAYAEKSNPLTEGKSQNFENYSDEVDFGDTEHALLDFDHREYSYRGIALAMAGDVQRWLNKTPYLGEKIPLEAKAAVQAVSEVARNIGPCISEWPDVSEHVATVTAAWKGIGRKQGWAEIPAQRRRFADLLCAMADEMAENQTIGMPMTFRSGVRL